MRAAEEVALGGVEAPVSSVGEDAPRASRRRDVGDDLGHRVLRERSLGAPAVERAGETLRVGNAGRASEAVGSFETGRSAAVRVAQEEPVVGLTQPRPDMQRRLHCVVKTERRQHGSDPPLLRLGLVGRSELLSLVSPQRAQPRVQARGVRLVELGPFAQALEQEVVREQPPVAEGSRTELELSLGGAHRCGVEPRRPGLTERRVAPARSSRPPSRRADGSAASSTTPRSGARD